MGFIAPQVIFEEAIMTSICCRSEFCIDYYFWPIFFQKPIVGPKISYSSKSVERKHYEGAKYCQAKLLIGIWTNYSIKAYIYLDRSYYIKFKGVVYNIIEPKVCCMAELFII